MDVASFSELRPWLTKTGLVGKSETALLQYGCCSALPPRTHRGVPGLHAPCCLKLEPRSPQDLIDARPDGAGRLMLHWNPTDAQLGLGFGQLLLRGAARPGQNGLCLHSKTGEHHLRPAEDFQDRRHIQSRNACRRNLWPKPVPNTGCACRRGIGSEHVQDGRFSGPHLEAVGPRRARALVPTSTSGCFPACELPLIEAVQITGSCRRSHP
jgi:hypothetical protein